MNTCIIEWPTGPARLEWTESNPESLAITGSHGFCFLDGQVVLCSIQSRGFSLPGGHMEEGETPEVCFRREAAEEACISLSNVELLGYLIADHSVNPSYDAPYPVRAAQTIFRAKIATLETFVAQHESQERILVSIKELPDFHHEWSPALNSAYQCALAKLPD
ncbi:MAG: NUDIX domain-containing protein [Pseudomonadota bacterium]